MAHDEIIFNGDGFIDNLDNQLQVEDKLMTSFSLPGSATPQAAQFMLGVLAGGAANYLNSFGGDPKTAGERFFNAESFFEDWARFADSGSALSESQILTQTRDAFIADYRTALGIGTTGAPTGDFATLLAGVQNLHDTGTAEVDPTTGAQVNVTDITDADIGEQFDNAFSHFLSNYPYFPGGFVGDPNLTGVARVESAFTEFFTNWSIFLSSTANLDNDTAGTASSTAVGLNSYEQVYLAFGFPASEFSSRLAQFYEAELKDSGGGDISRGYFLPSQSFGKWFETMQEEFLVQNELTSVDGVFNQNEDSAKKLLVLDRILRLLASLIGVLQQVTAAQADRLRFLTEWQQAYTERIVDIPTFQQNDGSFLTGDGDNIKEWRTGINAKMNSLLEKTKALRGNVQDEAKALQTTINQSQDAANQQAQIATSLLQQLSTILSQIFR